jgi:hypothetical protein
MNLVNDERDYNSGAATRPASLHGFFKNGVDRVIEHACYNGIELL